MKVGPGYIISSIDLVFNTFLSAHFGPFLPSVLTLNFTSSSRATIQLVAAFSVFFWYLPGRASCLFVLVVDSVPDSDAPPAAPCAWYRDRDN